MLCLLCLPQVAAAAEPRDSAGPSPIYIAVKTNMLYDAALVPNVGAEMYVGRDFSVGFDWNHAWWSCADRHRYWRIYGGEIYGRWWFGEKARLKPLTGHHVGLYVQAFTYDIEFGGTGYMGGEPGDNMLGRMNWGIGAEYGFSLPVHRRLNIDFSIGIGYFGGKYYEYRPLDGHNVWQATRIRRWFGPTRAEVSLVWLLGDRNVNKKGGRDGAL